MNKEEFEKKATELFKKYSFQESHGGELVVGENGYDYIIEQLSEALIMNVVGVRSEQLKPFNCINVIDGHEQCKEQCERCKVTKGF